MPIISKGGILETKYFIGILKLKKKIISLKELNMCKKLDLKKNHFSYGYIFLKLHANKQAFAHV